MGERERETGRFLSRIPRQREAARKKKEQAPSVALHINKGTFWVGAQRRGHGRLRRTEKGTDREGGKGGEDIERVGGEHGLLLWGRGLAEGRGLAGRGGCPR